MWIVIIIAVLVIWQIGVRATVKGAVNGAKRCKRYLQENRKNRGQ